LNTRPVWATALAPRQAARNYVRRVRQCATCTSASCAQLLDSCAPPLLQLLARAGQGRLRCVPRCTAPLHALQAQLVATQGLLLQQPLGAAEQRAPRRYAARSAKNLCNLPPAPLATAGQQARAVLHGAPGC